MERLNAVNWPTWSFQIRHMLRSRGLWKHVDGTETLPEGANEQKKNEYETRQAKAFGLIVMSVASSHIYLITSTESPAEAWKLLQEHFQKDTLNNRIYLKKRYFRMEMTEGKSIQQHLKEMKELTDRLAAIQCPIDEEDQVVTLLGSLPRSYATLVTALETRTGKLDLASVQQALTHEEMKLNEGGTGASGDAHDAALLGTQKTNRDKRYQPRPKSPPKCYGCQKVGHFHRDCPISPYRGPSKGSKFGHAAKTAVPEDPYDSAFHVTKCSGDRNSKWLIDSGASSHMTWNMDILSNYVQFDEPQSVGLGDGHPICAVGYGKVQLKMQLEDGASGSEVMGHVLYVPDLTSNLFSVRAVTEKGVSVEFKNTKCYIHGLNGAVKGIGLLQGKLFELQCVAVCEERAAVASDGPNEMDLWHQRLAHVGPQLLTRIVKDGLIRGVKVAKSQAQSFCEGCVKGKMSRKPCKSTGGIHSTRKLQLVHSDVCGPMQTESIGGKRYFVSFTDDYSRCAAVYFMRSKAEVLDKFKEFQGIATNDSGNPIGTLRSDNGGEYMSHEFREYLKQKGIRHETSVPHTPEQNGVAERLNRTLCEKARSMIAHAGLPKMYWAEAIATAAYLKNRLPTRTLNGDVTPYELWYERKADLSHTRVFGCIAYAMTPDMQRRKLDDKAVRLRFVGYDRTTKGYRLIDEDTRKVYKRRDVAFNEYDWS